MVDKFNKIHGYFKLEVIDNNGNVTDVVEDNNLIMDWASGTMADLASGKSTSNPIDKFVIGTNGHIGTDVTNLRTFGIDESNRELLFSEDASTINLPTYPDGVRYFYEVPFDLSVMPGNIADGGAKIDGVEAYVDPINTQNEGFITYTITLPVLAANGGDGLLYAPYTEAALYAGTNIFSMKVFNGKIKDSTTSLKITWKITF